MPQQKDIVKIAIQMPGAYPQLIQLDQVSTTGNVSFTSQIDLKGYKIKSSLIVIGGN